MIICLAVAAIISIFSIFAFFGHVMGNDYGLGPNMFDVMFGIEGNVGGYGVKWRLYPGMTVLFAIQALIIIIAIAALAVVYKMVTTKFYHKQAYRVSGAMIFLSSVAMILSFCTLPICDNADSGATLGVGPILYSCLHIAVIILLVIGILLQRNQFNLLVTDDEQHKAPVATPKQELPKEKPTPKKESEPLPLSENEKADLILKYKKMLDDGAITQEEYETKKKQLLK